jgi:hypothetical protein
MGTAMTLIIAYLLMSQMGISNPFAYVAVFAVWVIHLVFHEEGIGL